MGHQRDATGWQEMMKKMRRVECDRREQFVVSLWTDSVQGWSLGGRKPRAVNRLRKASRRSRPAAEVSPPPCRWRVRQFSDDCGLKNCVEERLSAGHGVEEYACKQRLRTGYKKMVDVLPTKNVLLIVTPSALISTTLYMVGTTGEGIATSRRYHKNDLHRLDMIQAKVYLS